MLKPMAMNNSVYQNNYENCEQSSTVHGELLWQWITGKGSGPSTTYFGVQGPL